MFQMVGLRLVFCDVARDDDAVVGIYADNASIKSTVQIGTEGNAIANGIVIGVTERLDVASVNQLIAVGRSDAHPRYAARMMIEFRNPFFEQTTPHKLFFVLRY